MFIEIDGSDLARLQPMFSAPHLSLLFRSVLQGNTSARLWVDTPAAPTSCLLWDGRHSLYLVGAADPAPFISALPQLLANISHWASAAKLHYFKVCPSGSSWEVVVEETLSGLARRERIMLRQGSVSLPQPTRVDGFIVERIDRACLENASLIHRDDLLDEIRGMWPSIDRFLSQGFGFIVRHDNTVVCWCTAEYVADGTCGIGIETVPEYQGMGLATLAAPAFVAECCFRGMVPHWDSWVDNVASLRVAQRVRFEPLCRYHVYVGRDLMPRTTGSIAEM